MPYSSLTADMSAPEYRAAQEAARLGYVLVSTDRDTDDWKRPGVAHIVQAATPRNGAGAVVMMHDAAWATAPRPYGRWTRS